MSTTVAWIGDSTGDMSDAGRPESGLRRGSVDRAWVGDSPIDMSDVDLLETVLLRGPTEATLLFRVATAGRPLHSPALPLEVLT